MKHIDDLYLKIPDYAKDIKLNLRTVLNPSLAPLDQNIIIAIALASAYSSKHKDLITVFVNLADKILDEKYLKGVKSAVSIMAMNNIYYRFTHLVSDQDYANMPAGLRMNIMANPGIEKKDFELISLAISSINGCGMCIDSHEQVLRKEGLKKEQIQHAIKIASVINAAAQILDIE